MKKSLNFMFYIQAEVKVTTAAHMEELVASETRIILLYSTKVKFIGTDFLNVDQDEANNIMGWARERDLTGTSYVWVVTQSVIGEMSGTPARFTARPQFPIGMLGSAI